MKPDQTKPMNVHIGIIMCFISTLIGIPTFFLPYASVTDCEKRLFAEKICHDIGSFTLLSTITEPAEMYRISGLVTGLIFCALLASLGISIMGWYHWGSREKAYHLRMRRLSLFIWLPLLLALLLNILLSIIYYLLEKGFGFLASPEYIYEFKIGGILSFVSIVCLCISSIVLRLTSTIAIQEIIQEKAFPEKPEAAK